jgi:hypothetical protein
MLEAISAFACVAIATVSTSFLSAPAKPFRVRQKLRLSIVESPMVSDFPNGF